MNRIKKFDPNFAVKHGVNLKEMTVYSCLEEPFRLHGLFVPDRQTKYFHRIPVTVARAVSDGVAGLSLTTAGGRLRFRTNSSKVTIFAEMGHIGKMSHFALTGVAGFDLYADDRYVNTFIPPYHLRHGFARTLSLNSAQEREITINFPLYAGVKSLHIGLDVSATLDAPRAYRHEKPVVYYGSSITQGGCASRPGNAYQSIISRRLDCDFVNLGFSGSAKGEPEMANYLRALSMSAFVFDYDYNAPTPEHLEKTHAKMFDAIRLSQPDLPVIMVSRPSVEWTEDTAKRFAVIRATYDRAVAAGDRNVILINGHEMMVRDADDGATVDNCHPNDYGFQAMARGIGDALATVLTE